MQNSGNNIRSANRSLSKEAWAVAGIGLLFATRGCVRQFAPALDSYLNSLGKSGLPDFLARIREKINPKLADFVSWPE